jgi:hypothetical protein
MPSLAVSDDPKLVVDASSWPLLIFLYPRIATAETVRDLYETWDEFLPRGPHAVLSDLRRFNPITASPQVRRMAALEVEKRREVLQRLLIAEARVVTDPVVRGLVTAFDWVVGSTFTRPLRNVRSREEAETFLRAEIAKYRFQ